MIYYLEEDNYINKYLLTYDKKEIKKLRGQIIYNCSQIVHVKKISSVIPCSDNKHFLKNLTVSDKPVATREHDNLPDENLYEISYDNYVFPYLVSLIDRLLNNDYSAIDEIFHPTEEDVKSSIDRKIKLLSKEIDSINNLDVSKKISKLVELKNLLEMKKLNVNQESILTYYKKLQSKLNIELINQIEKKEINKVESFFDDNYDKKLIIRRNNG